MLDLEVAESERAAVGRLCAEIGPVRAAKQLGISRDSLLRVLAKQPIRRGTVLVLRQALKGGERG